MCRRAASGSTRAHSNDEAGKPWSSTSGRPLPTTRWNTARGVFRTGTVVVAPCRCHSVNWSAMAFPTNLVIVRLSVRQE
ncbi:hypothetical protein Amsp01_043090 [Amycolatopsis sp. NBRC 101858]|nr:hypothetical protein Amsp01_043090 [Amycolatopsis sp. NBRC 101858]